MSNTDPSGRETSWVNNGDGKLWYVSELNLLEPLAPYMPK